MNVVRNLKTLFKPPIQSSNLLYGISVKKKICSHPTRCQTLPETGYSLPLRCSFYICYNVLHINLESFSWQFIFFWWFKLSGPDCSPWSSNSNLIVTWQRIQTKYSHIAFISLRLPLLPSKRLHYLQPFLTWFGSEDPHVLIVPWDSILQMWDEQSRLNWILILDTLVQLKELTIALLFWQPKHVSNSHWITFC